MLTSKYRRANEINKEEAIENGTVFSMEEIDDVLDLIAGGFWPTAAYSDAECELYALIKKKLGIHY